MVALYSCEAEYIAASTVTCKGIWLSRLLAALYGRANCSAFIFVDNQSAIQLCKNPVFHGRSKHIETRFHFIRECVEDGKVCVQKIDSDEQLADILTKPLGRAKFLELRTKMGVINVNAAHQN